VPHSHATARPRRPYARGTTGRSTTSRHPSGQGRAGHNGQFSIQPGTTGRATNRAGHDGPVAARAQRAGHNGQNTVQPGTVGPRADVLWLARAGRDEAVGLDGTTARVPSTSVHEMVANAWLSAAPLARVVSERAVSTDEHRQRASRRRGDVKKGREAHFHSRSPRIAQAGEAAARLPAKVAPRLGPRQRCQLHSLVSRHS
jgi:hypothetical protein